MLKLPFFSKNSILLFFCISSKDRIESIFSCVHSSLPSASRGRTIRPRSSDPELTLACPESKINIFFFLFVVVFTFFVDDDDTCNPIAAPMGPFPITTTSNAVPDGGGSVRLSLTIASPQEILLLLMMVVVFLPRASVAPSFCGNGVSAR